MNIAHGEEGMQALLIEMVCPQHGLERFRIKVTRKFNMPKKAITPKFRSRPKRELSCLLVGREVTSFEVERFIAEYFQRNGTWDRIILIKTI